MAAVPDEAVLLGDAPLLDLLQAAGERGDAVATAEDGDDAFGRDRRHGAGAEQAQIGVERLGPPSLAFEDVEATPDAHQLAFGNGVEKLRAMGDQEQRLWARPGRPVA